MRLVPVFPRCHMVAVAALAIFAASSRADKAATPEEATRVRFLIVADTDAREGAASGFDAKNLRSVLEVGLGKQKLAGRYTIDVIAGNDVAPERVLAYYRDLKVAANEALVFYYSGHGAYHSTRGHLLTFVQGDLTRASVLAAMQWHKPRLAAVLTDCCAVHDGVAPPQAKLPAAPPGRRSLAEAADGDSGQAMPAHPPRPKDYAPPGSVSKAMSPPIAHPPRPANYRPSPPFLPHPDDNLPGTDNPVLRTADGPLPLKTLLAETNGEVLRHLFYRHTGVVDINACEKGKVAFATTRWGGGLFTIALLSMQKDQPARFDSNRNGLVEWREFFTSLRANCKRMGTVLAAGAIQQTPQAHSLGHPVLRLAGR